MIFINKGDVPMTRRQAIKRGLRYFESERAQWEREQGIVESDPDYMQWASQWVEDNLVNAENNLFNHQLYAYRKAVARLAEYRKAEGRSEITEERETDEYDDNGDPVIEAVVVQTAIDPLPFQIEQTVYNDETGESSVAMTGNPEIVKDDAERAAAQSIINSLPQEIKEFSASVDSELMSNRTNAGDWIAPHEV